jgi:hypothetical protein
MAIERSVINRCYAKNSESSTGGYYLSRPEPGGSDPLDEQCGDLIYQMVHRAASAAEAGSSLRNYLRTNDRPVSYLVV